MGTKRTGLQFTTRHGGCGPVYSRQRVTRLCLATMTPLQRTHLQQRINRAPGPTYVYLSPADPQRIIVRNTPARSNNRLVGCYHQRFRFQMLIDDIEETRNGAG